jgi:hypothetical protein
MVVTGRCGRHQNRDLAEFGRRLSPLLACSISDQYPTKKLFRLGTVRAFVRFDSDWQTGLLPVAANLVPFLKRSSRRRLVPYFRETLRPVLTSIGHPPPMLQTSAVQVGAAGCLGLVFVVFVGVLVILLLAILS